MQNFTLVGKTDGNKLVIGTSATIGATQAGLVCMLDNHKYFVLMCSLVPSRTSHNYCVQVAQIFTHSCIIRGLRVLCRRSTFYTKQLHHYLLYDL